MLLCLLSFCVLLSSCAFVQSESWHDRFYAEVQNEDEIIQEDGTRNWPWNKNNFKCPSSFGSFPDPTDCSAFYVCLGGRGTRGKCQNFQNFDKFRKKCMSMLIAVCDKTGQTTTNAPLTTKRKGTTSNDEIFSCPSAFGSHMHPTDCSKYYTCTIYFPSLKSCPENELFDGVKKQCKPAKDVHCGSRIKPTETVPITDPVTEPVTETPKSSSTTVKTDIPTEPETTSSSPDTPINTTPEEPITSEPTTKPTGPPETNCDKDDLECIIDETGETPDWFTCPEDMGSYPHPSSGKLFIFCRNWKPSVKKCGQDLVYSNILRTCVDP